MKEFRECLWNRLISPGVELLPSYAENSCITSYNRQFSTVYDVINNYSRLILLLFIKQRTCLSFYGQFISYFFAEKRVLLQTRTNTLFAALIISLLILPRVFLLQLSSRFQVTQLLHTQRLYPYVQTYLYLRSQQKQFLNLNKKYFRENDIQLNTTKKITAGHLWSFNIVLDYFKQ